MILSRKAGQETGNRYPDAVTIERQASESKLAIKVSQGPGDNTFIAIQEQNACADLWYTSSIDNRAEKIAGNR